MIQRRTILNSCKFMIILILHILFLQQVFSQSVVLVSLEPDSGPAGTLVRITGTGFSSAGNTVIFRSTETPPMYNLEVGTLLDGNSITFTVPTALGLDCHFDPNQDPPCPAPMRMTPPGVYDVYIGTMYTVDSNILPFTVPVKTGDVSGDTIVDIVDALLIAQYYVGLNPANLKHLSAADVNCVDGINIVDALLTAQFYVGIISELPGCAGAPTPEPTPTCSYCTMVISGHVTDSAGNPILGATIAYFTDVPPEATTGASGYYEFTTQAPDGPPCPVSDLSLYVEAVGYKPVVNYAIVVRCGNATYDFTLIPIAR